MTKRKLSLISGLAVSLFAIVTASVSTFAWFQAEANVQIQASPSSTTISVSAPDDLDIPNPPTLYAYNDNFTEVSTGVYDNHGYKRDDVTNKVSMRWEKISGSHNFYPYYTKGGNVGGFYATELHTRAMDGHKITIIPEEGFTISNIVFTTFYNAGNPCAEWLSNFTWENGSANKDSTSQVTVTPTDGTKSVSTVVTSHTIRFTRVVINYTVGESTTWNLNTNSYAYCGDNTARYEDTDYYSNTNMMAWVSSNTPAVITRDFLPLTTNALKNALLTTDQLAPGYKMTFAIKAVGSHDVTNASFYLEKYTSIRMMNRIKMTNKTTRSGYVVAIDEAINIYGSVNSSGWYFGSGVNRFDSFNYSEAPDLVSYDSGDVYGNIQTNVYDSEGENHEYSRNLLGEAEAFESDTVYFFFTIEFSNEDSTYYSEYNKVGADAVIMTNKGNDYKVESTYDPNYRYYQLSYGVFSLRNPQPTESQVSESTNYIAKERYFVLDDINGNSNCYEGLSFQINRIKLELS